MSALLINITNRSWKNKNLIGSYLIFPGGQGWIRTIEDIVDGFTVRCIWPLCNLPMCERFLSRLELAKGIEPSTC